MRNIKSITDERLKEIAAIIPAPDDESPEIMVNEGDVLIVKTGSSFGKTGIIKEKS